MKKCRQAFAYCNGLAAQLMVMAIAHETQKKICVHTEIIMWKVRKVAYFLSVKKVINSVSNSYQTY